MRRVLAAASLLLMGATAAALATGSIADGRRHACGTVRPSVELIALSEKGATRTSLNAPSKRSNLNITLRPYYDDILRSVSLSRTYSGGDISDPLNLKIIFLEGRFSMSTGQEFDPIFGNVDVKSPWVRIISSEIDPCSIQITILNQGRQVLIDQLALSAGPSGSDRVRFLTRQEFRHFASQFSKEAEAIAPDISKSKISVPTLRASMPGVPADIFWLFTRSPFIGLEPFSSSAISTWDDEIIRTRPRHRKIVSEIVRKFFLDQESGIVYNSILQLDLSGDESRTLQLSPLFTEENNRTDKY
jgi:hypothetical protein